MYLQQRWVPMELIYTLLAGSVVMIIIMWGALYWLDRSGKNASERPKKQNATSNKKRSQRKRR
jgi:hypothetical protein